MTVNKDGLRVGNNVSAIRLPWPVVTWGLGVAALLVVGLIRAESRGGENMRNIAKLTTGQGALVRQQQTRERDIRTFYRDEWPKVLENAKRLEALERQVFQERGLTR